MTKSKICPVCKNKSTMLDVVDFNKNCLESAGVFLPLEGVPIYYYQCENCLFTFAPEFQTWSDEKFLKKIYNDEYIKVDSDYLENRPRQNSKLLIKTFEGQKNFINHIDYGGGNGLLSKLLNLNGWNSTTYDPFPSNQINVESLGKYNLITAFEVFEHVPDPNRLMSNLQSLMQSECLILFSTLLSDEAIKPNQRLTWWYASPRNGHISLYSRKSLELLGQKYGLIFGSFNNGLHCYVNKIPNWAKSIFVKN